MTKEASQATFGKDVITESTSEYIALALLLVHERYENGQKSFWWPYINILPDTIEVNPSYTWSDDELALLEGKVGSISHGPRTTDHPYFCQARTNHQHHQPPTTNHQPPTHSIHPPIRQALPPSWPPCR